MARNLLDNILEMRRSGKASPWMRAVSVALASLWMPYFIIYCTKCPDAPTILFRCGVVANQSSDGAHDHRTGEQVAHGHHDHAVHGHHEAETEGTSGNHKAHDPGDDCCDSAQIRAATANSGLDAKPMPAMAVVSDALIPADRLPDSESFSPQRVEHYNHSPPLYLSLRTLLI
jgi:hypothetical protein